MQLNKLSQDTVKVRKKSKHLLKTELRAQSPGKIEMEFHTDNSCAIDADKLDSWPWLATSWQPALIHKLSALDASFEVNPSGRLYYLVLPAL